MLQCGVRLEADQPGLERLGRLWSMQLWYCSSCTRCLFVCKLLYSCYLCSTATRL